MQPVLNAALPIFALILTGYGTARLGILGRAATDSLNRFAVFLALPALLFQAMTRITPESSARPGSRRPSPAGSPLPSRRRSHSAA